jgi:hypothetical protein
MLLLAQIFMYTNRRKISQQIGTIDLMHNDVTRLDAREE